MSSSVVTRFAPSPTGFLHIGGARTALFNWAFAKANAGKMLLRIEDTDRERSTQEAVDAIIEGLTWLGLDWDGEPVSQFARADRHREVVEQLLASGHAYRCYCMPEELQDMRQQAKAEGRPIGYDGTWRDRDPAQAPAGVSPVIRFKAPAIGETHIADEVQGDVVYQNKDLDDLIILRSDGSPTYNLSVVVDDHDMGVTDIVRGVDHLTNAARQTQIYRALGWSVPQMAHIPLIHGPDGAKLSKRHGALGVEAYREMGYLPQAMRNYLARLGWSHGDDEIFSTEQLVEWFSLSAIGRSAARFDFAKLENLNGHYIRSTSDEELLRAVVEFYRYCPREPWMPNELGAVEQEKLQSLLPGLKERAKTLVDLVHGAAFLFKSRPLSLDDKAANLLTAEASQVLAGVHTSLAALKTWNTETTETAIREFAEKNELKLGKVAQPLRAALTGTTTSPGIFDVLAALGRDEALERISDRAAG
jgi:glutamyl-tRNA synthetase